MSGKVLLPKEVAEAIEVLQRAFNYGLYELINVAHSPKDYEDKDEAYYITTIDTYSQGKYDDVINAIVNGYEVEKSPEERVWEKYRSHSEIASLYAGESLDKYEYQQERYSSGYIRGVKDFAKSYGIKIEGVGTDDET